MDKQDFYFENNCIVLTESFLKKRGFCCHNNCRHCPYKGSRMRYFLHTNNDLIFEFDHGELVTLKGEITNLGSIIGPVQVQELETLNPPFKAIINEEEYTIVRFNKINEKT